METTENIPPAEPTNVEVQPENQAAVEQKLSPVKLTRPLKFLLVFVAVLFLLLILVILLKPKALLPTAVVPQASPSSLTTVTPVPRPVSQFGQTPQFTQFEASLNALISTQENLDLTEAQLAFPVLEMNVNYKK